MNIQQLIAKQLAVMSEQLEVLEEISGEGESSVSAEDVDDMIAKSLMKMPKKEKKEAEEKQEEFEEPEFYPTRRAVPEEPLKKTRLKSKDPVAINKHGKAASKTATPKFKKGDTVQYYPKASGTNSRWGA